MTSGLLDIEARLRIRDAVDRNFVLYDQDRMIEAYAGFAEDAVLEPNPPAPVCRGRDEILARFRARPDGRLADYGYIRHCLLQQVVTALTERNAEASSYYLVFVDGAVVSTGVLHDSFVRAGQNWLIAHRRVRADLPVADPFGR